jgi:hypothetical protein
MYFYKKSTAMTKVIVEQLTESEINLRKIRNWPIWEKGVSRFDWKYEGDEECFILEGEFTVETPDGKFNVEKGDFVTFKNGLKCTWDIKKPVKKHYNFP